MELQKNNAADRMIKIFEDKVINDCNVAELY